MAVLPLWFWILCQILHGQAALRGDAGLRVSSTGISNLTCAGNSPNSLLCSWITTTVSDSQVSCGVSSGNYSYSTPVVNVVKFHDPYYGVTSHSVAITVPTTNTNPRAYFCVATSRNTSFSSHTTEETTAGTLGSIASVPFTVASYSAPPIYYNDQYAGLHGMPATGRYYDSDTMYGTWADDGWYMIGNDFLGAMWCCSNNAGAVKLSSDQLTITQFGNTTGANNTGPVGGTNYPATYTADGSRDETTGIISVRGAIYQFMSRNTNICGNIFKTKDHFATTIGPLHNTGPSAVGIMFTGSGQGNYDYPNTQSECSGQIGLEPFFARFCQDWGGASNQFACTHNAGTDGWVYAYTNIGPPFFQLVRVRIENIALTAPGSIQTYYQTYNGSGHGADGLLDSNWIPYDGGVTGTKFSQSGIFPQPHWIPAPFNRWAIVSWEPVSGSDLYEGQATEVWDLGQWPWAVNDGVLVASVPNDPVVYPTYFPTFANLIMPTYTNMGNGTARVRMSSTGTWEHWDHVNPSNDRYSPVFTDLVLGPR
jgi:hypothetical protein